MPDQSEAGPRATDWFGLPLATGELKRRSVRGTLVSLASRVANQLVGIVSLVFLARMLTPADFGLVAMITAVIGLAGILQDMGFSAATIRAKTINHHQISNLFWINLLAGSAMTLLVTLASPIMAIFYNEPKVQIAAGVMSLSFVIGAASTQHQALLRRAMRFTDIAKIAIFSVSSGSAVSIAAAFYGLGYWALILGTIFGNVVSLILSWANCDWRPSKPKRAVGTRSLTTFGMHMVLFGVLGYLARNLHNLIIGRLWGASETGIYNRSTSIHAMLVGNVTDPMNLVAPAGMAQLSGKPDQFNAYYYRACTLVVIAALPIVFLGLALPHELILVLLGTQWGRSAELLQLLTIGVLPQTISYTTGWIYLSAGNSMQMMRWGVIGWTTIIIGTAIGAYFGLKGIALASSVSAFVLLIPSLAFAFSGTSLRISTLLVNLSKPLAAGSAAGIICFVGLNAFVSEGALQRLLIGGTSYIIIFLLLLLTVFGQRRLMSEIFSEIKRR